MPEDVEGVVVGAHAFLEGLRVYLFEDVVEGLFDILPGLIQVLHVQLQVRKLHLPCSNALHLLRPQLIQMLITQGVDSGCHCIVKVDQHVLLPAIVFLQVSGASTFKLALQVEDVAHEGSEFLVARVTGIVGELWDCPLAFGGSDTGDCEALTSCLRGTYPAIEHVFLLYADHVLRSLAAVAFIGAALLTSSRWPGAEVNLLWGRGSANRTDHGLSRV